MMRPSKSQLTIFGFVLLGVILLMKDAKPRGIRNNNPLNIETGEDWLGLTGSDGRFATFETPEHGIRAAARIMRTYSVKYGLNTINTIVSRWAPPIENDTTGYIQFVADKANVQPDDVLASDDYTRVIAAMIHMENGEQPYSMETIKKGFEWGFYG